MLTLFILMSVYHFGKGDTAGNAASRPIDVVARGGMILIPIRVHAAEVATIFTYLVGGHAVEPVMVVLSYVGYLHMAALAISLRSHFLRSHHFEHLLILLECATLCVVFCTMSPLMSFVIYYNMFFAARQLIGMHKNGVIRSAKEGRWLQGPALLTCVVAFITIMALVAWFAVDVYQRMETSGQSLQVEAIGPTIRVVFIGLSALKIPHILAASTLPPLRGKSVEI